MPLGEEEVASAPLEENVTLAPLEEGREGGCGTGTIVEASLALLEEAEALLTPLVKEEVEASMPLAEEEVQ